MTADGDDCAAAGEKADRPGGERSGKATKSTKDGPS